MKMINVSKDVLNGNYKPGKVQNFINEFVASDKDIIEVGYAEDEYPRRTHAQEH